MHVDDTISSGFCSSRMTPATCSSHGRRFARATSPPTSTWSVTVSRRWRICARQDEYVDADRPDLILLDLNLPRMSGHEVLAEVKADESLRRIPVVVLTTSTAVEDITRSYDLHANVYVAKPVDFDDFADVVKQIDDFFSLGRPTTPGLTVRRRQPRAYCKG